MMDLKYRFLCLALGFTFLICSVIFFTNIHDEMEIVCDYDKDYRDVDILCGDFGFYYFKMLSLVMLGAGGMFLIISGWGGWKL